MAESSGPETNGAGFGMRGWIDEHAAADILAMIPCQGPTAVRCWTSQFRTETSQVVTAIWRTWKPGDTARCRLCPVCTASGDECLIQTDAKLGAADPRSFSTACGVTQDMP